MKKTTSKSTQYGHFSRNHKEYIITNPKTPLPWFNYLFNNEYHALVSQTGGGFSYYKDPKSHRILRYDHIHTDRPGRYLFIRDQNSKKTWSPNWQPFCKPLNQWECRHGLGYTTIQASHLGIQAEITYSVPLNKPIEIWQVRIKNLTSKTKNLSVFPFVEFITGDLELENNYRNILCLYNEGLYDKKLESIVVKKMRFHRNNQETHSFFHVSGGNQGYTAHKLDLYGIYRGIHNPEAILDKGKLPNTDCRGEDMVGCFQKNIRLKGKQETKFVVIAGAAPKPSSIRSLIKSCNSYELANKELIKIHQYWKRQLSKVVVSTPDTHVNTMVNIWGRYQLSAITHWRGTSQYHGAEGGLGYRDTAQDAEGLLSVDLPLAIEKMNKLLFWQYQSGHAVSGFSDTEGSWDAGASPLAGKSDVSVWLVYLVVSYIKETGDKKFLKKIFPFHDGGKATVYEHILRTVRYLYRSRGKWFSHYP